MRFTPEKLILDAESDPMDLCTAPRSIDRVEMNPAKKQLSLVSSTGGEGALPLEAPQVDVMTMRFVIRIDESETMEEALADLRALTQKLDEAVNVEGGMPLAATPRGATVATTYYVLHGEVTELPREMTGDDIGWYHGSPVAHVELLCKPYGYGGWSTPVTASGTGPVLEAEITGIEGDVDAEGEMTVTDSEGVDRAHLEWGLEALHYDATTPTDVILNLASGLVVAGYWGSSTTESGSYSTNTVEADIATAVVALCGTGTQDHIGHKRIKIRCKSDAEAETAYARLAWRVGDGTYSYNDWVETIAESQWIELDLGTITIPPAQYGSQRWEGRIEVYADAACRFIVDYMEVFPAERFATARAQAGDETPSEFVAYDNFSAASGGLDGDAAVKGGNWDTIGGDPADFQAGAGNTVTRNATADAAGVENGRWAVLGTTDYDACTVGITVVRSYFSGLISAIGARCDGTTSNGIYGYVANPGTAAYVVKRVAGVTTMIKTAYPVSVSANADLKLVVNADGTYSLYANDVLLAWGTDSDLATGGALDSGRPFIIDHYTGAVVNTRTYSEFYVSQPDPPVVCHANQDAVITHEAAVRYDAAGTYVAPMPSYRGARLFIPPAGDAGRAVRIVTKMRRSDIAVAADSPIDDEHAVSIRWRSRYRFPRDA